jgi:hypothetical protein
MSQNDVRRERGQFRRVPANFRGISCGPARVDAHVAADAPTQLLQPLQERPDAGLKFGIIRACGQQHADPPRAIGLLRARRERPRCRTAEKRDELAPFHSITLSASASNYRCRP